MAQVTEGLKAPLLLLFLFVCLVDAREQPQIHVYGHCGRYSSVNTTSPYITPHSPPIKAGKRASTQGKGGSSARLTNNGKRQIRAVQQHTLLRGVHPTGPHVRQVEAASRGAHGGNGAEDKGGELDGAGGGPGGGEPGDEVGG